MKKDRLLTTGEFARLCRTTKETLFHYDRMGLLAPKYVSANGYRRYDVTQFFDFDLIWVLKEAGSSLAEIREYLSTYNPDRFLELLDDQRRQLDEELARLDRRRKMLARIVDLTRRALSGPHGRLEVLAEKREKLLGVEVPDGEGELTWSDTVDCLDRLFVRCDQVGQYNVFPVGTVFLREDMERGVFREKWFFTRADPEIKAPPDLVKPGGAYASVMFRGNYDRLMENLRKLPKRLKAAGLKMGGDVYVYEMLSYLGSREADNDVHQALVKLEG